MKRTVPAKRGSGMDSLSGNKQAAIGVGKDTTVLHESCTVRSGRHNTCGHGRKRKVPITVMQHVCNHFGADVRLCLTASTKHHY